MASTEIFLIGIYLIDVAFILALYKFARRHLIIGAIVNMILISIFAQKTVEYAGVISNVGNIFYAAVIFTMSLLAIRTRSIEFSKKLTIVFFSQIIFIVLAQFVAHLPILAGNEMISEAISSLTGTTIQIAAASFIAFYISNGVNYGILSLLNRPFYKIETKKWIMAKPVANVVSQAVDSAIFFPIAFSSIWGFDQILMAGFAGFAMKAILNLLDTPFSLLVLRWEGGE